MKIAILGGGSAGCMAAAHLTRHFPDAELVHIFDSRVPIIGVGEGTTPAVPVWFEEITGQTFSELRVRCAATLKHGTRFEGWGRGATFLHAFQPAGVTGYHLDAEQLVSCLREHVRARVLDARIVSSRSSEIGAELVFEDGSAESFDFILDARGFPHSQDEDVLSLEWIPTNAATVRRSPARHFDGVTRAIARPHGWIFAIPLDQMTSFGYIYNAQVSPIEQVEADFAEVLSAEGVQRTVRHLRLRFPNFVRRTCFDGAIFYIGNAASFIEPIEAISIGTTIVQLRSATRWIRENASRRATPAARAAAAAYNASMLSYIVKNSLFISWHYSNGSRHRSPFWEYAAGCFARARARARPELAGVLADFDEFLAVAPELPTQSLAELRDREVWNRDVFPKLVLHRPFGNFSELNIAQVARGLGFFDAPTEGS